MIRSLVLLVVAVAALSRAPSAFAFVSTPAFSASASASTAAASSSSALFAYIPDGLTKVQWEKIKKKENEAKKNLGKVGPRGFKSRSMQSFQEALERGEATHLLPVFNAKERIAKGELKKEDIPYMQRGGSWDNSDVKGARRIKWLASDKEYASGGYKKEQSVSILGTGAGLDWTGTQSRSGPELVSAKPVKMGKNYKAPNVNDWAAEKKKGPFGWW